MSHLEAYGRAHQVPFDVVLIGTSWGGVQALRQLVSSLPPDFATPIVIVQHRSDRHPFLLADLLSRRTALRVVNAEKGDRLQAGVIYLAIPNQHLSFDARGYLKLTDTERVNFVRPSIDILFQSAATVFKNRVLAVVLTGKGKDGAAGAIAIKAAGGVVITQDKASSEAFGMPGAAIATQQIDFVLPLSQIGSALVTLTMRKGAADFFHVSTFPSYYLS